MTLSLRSQLITLCASILLAALALVAASNYLTTRSALLEMVDTQASQMALAHAQRIGSWLQGRKGVVSTLKQHVAATDRLEILQNAQAANNYDLAYIGYPDGSAVFSAQRQRAADYDPRQRIWYQGALQTARPTVSEPYIGASSGKLIVTFSELVGTPQHVQGVVAADVVMDEMISSVNAIQPTSHSFAFVVSAAGSLATHPNPQFLAQPLSTVYPGMQSADLLAASSAAARTWTLDGRTFQAYTHNIPGTQWQLTLMMDMQEATAALQTGLWTSLLTCIGVALLTALILYMAITRGLHRLHAVREAITAAGHADFRQRLHIVGNDELTQIARAYNQFRDNLVSVLHSIQGSSGSVEVAASEISTGNQHLSERTELQAQSLAQTCASLENLTQNVQRNAAHAGSATQLASTAFEIAQQGGSAMHEVVRMMESIDQSSRKIADIISVIDGIAFQTNILALNAAVEAARAGEQGRGFAVVAGEVRTLAQRSAAAAKEIRSLIQASVHNIAQGSDKVAQAGQTMQDIVGSVQHVNSIMSEISQASQQQSQEIGQINQAIAEMEAGTQQNSALVEEATAAAQSLQEQAVLLAQLVRRFQLQSEHQPTPGNTVLH